MTYMDLIIIIVVILRGLPDTHCLKMDCHRSFLRIFCNAVVAGICNNIYLFVIE